jgi:polygalacturonase
MHVNVFPALAAAGALLAASASGVASGAVAGTPTGTATSTATSTDTRAVTSAGANTSTSTINHPAATAVFNVKSYGATGDGKTVDTPAVNKAIAAASAATGGGIVEFPAGTYKSVSIHLLSNVTLQLDAGSTVSAAPSGFDAPEANPYSQYQDFGHSHFHDALIWGENLTNVGFTGSGTIDGAGNLHTGNIGSGQADKAVSLAVVNGLTISGITIKRAGHFGILLNGGNHVTVDHLTISTATDRDGFNVINTANMTVTNTDIASVDDALVFKSDFALGRTYPSTNINVSDSTVSSTGNNGLQFGSETCGDFSDVHFSHITISSAGKAGIGIVSMDGAHISNITYNDITMTHAATPIFIKLGSRGSCPGHPGPGSISGISLTNVTGTALSDGGSYTSTITGLPGHPVTDVTLTNVNLTVPGGDPASDATITPPEKPTSYVPKDYGTRPSYGWWLRHVGNITFQSDKVGFSANDGRPAFQTTDGTSVSLNAVVVQRGSGSAYDIGFASSPGESVTGGMTTTGAALRVHVS